MFREETRAHMSKLSEQLQAQGPRELLSRLSSENVQMKGRAG